ncbi:predicted protein [Nematostella vectensis]|uniref:Uncharacterized protein n=1 Tax=Nematostella vectensis TaxID=45351 RepID=A7T6X9_NEMVE|nr:predicted protein [Nematostella vectensis]|eukprot:XP_001620375.1 hypothetical protein NEMVEDRAFT_v1g223181 [Nematostella vectensis]
MSADTSTIHHVLFTCYPSCDAGCCAANSGSPQASPAYQPPLAYPGYQAPSPYDPYSQYSNPAGCAPECAPANTPECCRSQALQLNIRPALSANPAPTEKPEPTTRPSPPTQKQADKPKISKLKAAKQIRPGTLCLRKCQKLCHSKCKFVCCLPTHKHFDDDPKPVKKLKPTYYRKKVCQLILVPYITCYSRAIPDDYQQPTGSSYVSQAPYATQAAQGIATICL